MSSGFKITENFMSWEKDRKISYLNQLVKLIKLIRMNGKRPG